MDFSSLDQPENRPCVSQRNRSCFVRSNHPNIVAAIVTPGENARCLMPNRHSFTRFKGDDCCFFLAPHACRSRFWVAAVGSAKIRASLNIPPKSSEYQHLNGADYLRRGLGKSLRQRGIFRKVSEPRLAT